MMKGMEGTSNSPNILNVPNVLNLPNVLNMPNVINLPNKLNMESIQKCIKNGNLNEIMNVVKSEEKVEEKRSKEKEENFHDIPIPVEEENAHWSTFSNEKPNPKTSPVIPTVVPTTVQTQLQLGIYEIIQKKAQEFHYYIFWALFLGFIIGRLSA